MRTEDRRTQDETGPYRYGKHLTVNYTTSQHGIWEQLPSGNWLWRLRILSRQAMSVSLGLSQFNVPEGAQFFVYGSNRNPVRGPYTASDTTAGELWTPLVRGERITLELEVPETQRSEVALTVGTVVHGYRSLTSGSDSSPRKSGACNRDVACEEADPWRNQVRSVGGYTFGEGGFHLTCTGALINNSAENGRPLFLTAEHCVSSPSQAPSLVFYWNFQVDTCRPLGTDRNGTFPESLSLSDWSQTSTGARMLARYGNVHSKNQIAGKPDLTLLEVDDSIPENYDLYLSGWSRSNTTTQKSVTIHHPSGHGKRISIDQNSSSLIDYPTSGTCPIQAPSGDTHLEVANWELGTTEPGSSGSPLFNTNRRIVGVLSGGCAGCDGGGTQDNDNADWYGRLAAGFGEGDYQERPIGSVLDPEDTETETLPGRFLVIDDTPPAAAENFEFTSVSADALTLRWIAPGDDGTRNGPAERYVLRYRTTAPIRTNADFDAARAFSQVPLPGDPGTIQSVTVPVAQDSSYFFALRVLDEQGGRSPIASIDRGITPVEGLRVTLPPTPNPTQGQVRLRFVVDESQPIRAELYDALGRRIRVLYNEEPPAFQQQTISANLSRLSSGVYFVRIQGRSAARTKQISVVR